MDGRTNRPSYRDAFLTDESKNGLFSLLKFRVNNEIVHLGKSLRKVLGRKALLGASRSNKARYIGTEAMQVGSGGDGKS